MRCDDAGEQRGRAAAEVVAAQRQLVDALEQHARGGRPRVTGDGERVEPGLERPRRAAAGRRSRATVVHRELLVRAASSASSMRARSASAAALRARRAARIASGAAPCSTQPGEAGDERRASCRCRRRPTTSSGPPACVTARALGGGEASSRGHHSGMCMTHARCTRSPADWLGASPARDGRACATCSRRTRRRAERVGRDRHARRGRRPHAGHRPGAEDAIFAELDALHADGRPLHRRLRGARRGRLRRPGRARGHRPDRRLAERQARAARTTRSRSRSPTGRRWPTSSFGYVYDFGAERGVGARRAARARCSTASRSTRRCRRAPRPRRAPRAARHRVGRPALGGARRSTTLGAVAHRLRAIGSIADLAVPGGRGALDGMASLWRARAVDAAAAQLIVREGGAARRVPALRRSRSARRWTSSRARRCAGRAARACARRGSRRRRCHRWRRWSTGRLAARLAGTIAGEPPPPPAAAATSTRWPRTAAQRVRRLHAAASRGRRCPPPEAVGRQAWIEVNLAGDARRSSTRVVEKLREGPAGTGPLAGRGAGRGRYVLAVEVGGLLGFLSQRVLGQYELVLLDPTSQPRLLFVAPNLRRGRGQARGRPRASSSHWVGPARGHARRPVRRVPWLREHLAGAAARAARRPRRGGRPAGRCSCPTRDDLRRARRRGARGRTSSRSWPARSAGDHRPHPGDDGGHRGPRRARDGRGRARRAARPRHAARARSSAAARGPRRWPGCSSGCSGWSSSCASTGSARASATRSSTREGDRRRSTGSGDGPSSLPTWPSSRTRAWLRPGEPSRRRPDASGFLCAGPVAKKDCPLRTHVSDGSADCPRSSARSVPVTTFRTVYKHVFAGILRTTLELTRRVIPRGKSRYGRHPSTNGARPPRPSASTTAKKAAGTRARTRPVRPPARRRAAPPVARSARPHARRRPPSATADPGRRPGPGAASSAPS